MNSVRRIKAMTIYRRPLHYTITKLIQTKVEAEYAVIIRKNKMDMSKFFIYVTTF